MNFICWKRSIIGTYKWWLRMDNLRKNSMRKSWLCQPHHISESQKRRLVPKPWKIWNSLIKETSMRISAKKAKTHTITVWSDRTFNGFSQYRKFNRFPLDLFGFLCLSTENSNILQISHNFKIFFEISEDSSYLFLISHWSSLWIKCFRKILKLQ